MRRLALLLLPLILALGCTPTGSGGGAGNEDANLKQKENGITGEAPAADTPAEDAAPAQPAAVTDPNPAATANKAAAQAGPFASLQVDITGNPDGNNAAKPGATVPLSVSFCNTSAAAMPDLQLRVVPGTMATLAEQQYMSFQPLGIALEPSNGDCSAKSVKMDFHLQLSNTVQPGTSHNFKPVFVLKLGEEIHTVEAPFNYSIQG